jgi:hypothetical protein
MNIFIDQVYNEGSRYRGILKDKARVVVVQVFDLKATEGTVPEVGARARELTEGGALMCLIGEAGSPWVCYFSKVLSVAVKFGYNQGQNFTNQAVIRLIKETLLSKGSITENAETKDDWNLLTELPHESIALACILVSQSNFIFCIFVLIYLDQARSRRMGDGGACSPSVYRKRDLTKRHHKSGISRIVRRNLENRQTSYQGGCQGSHDRVPACKIYGLPQAFHEAGSVRGLLFPTH